MEYSSFFLRHKKTMGMRLWRAAAAARCFSTKVMKSGPDLKSEKSIFLFYSELSCPISQERRMELEPLVHSKHPVDRLKSYIGYSMQNLTHVVRRIKLNTNVVEVEEEELGVEDYIVSHAIDRNGNMTNCTALRSKIIMPLLSKGGFSYKHIACFDTSKTPMKFRVSSPADFDIRSFSTPKSHNMKLGEIDGKLYCIDFRDWSYTYEDNDPHNDALFNHFEVFDPKSPCLRRPLDFPFNFRKPHDGLRPPTPATFFLPQTKKILISDCTAIYWFDVADPSSGWTIKGYCNSLPLYAIGFRVHNHHPDTGGFYIVFELQTNGESPCIDVSFESDTFEISRPTNHSVHLPQLCSRYLVDNRHHEYLHNYMDRDTDSESDNRTEPCDIETFTYRFIDLGAQKVGLLVNKYVQGKNKGFLLLVKFEYDIIITTTSGSKPNLDIEIRFLGTRQFQHEAVGLPDSEIYDNNLKGAFFI